jgi:hypothetical protein
MSYVFLQSLLYVAFAGAKLTDMLQVREADYQREDD